MNSENYVESWVLPYIEQRVPLGKPRGPLIDSGDLNWEEGGDIKMPVLKPVSYRVAEGWTRPDGTRMVRLQGLMHRSAVMPNDGGPWHPIPGYDHEVPLDRIKLIDPSLGD